MADVSFEPQNLSEYRSAPVEYRVAYLHQVTEGELSASNSFYVDALRAEQHPLAKWYLIKAVGMLRNEEAVPLLIEVGRNFDVELRQTSLHRVSAWALGQIGKSAVGQLKEALANARNDSERIFFVDALGEIGSPNSVFDLENAYLCGTDEVKLWAVLSLAKIGRAAETTLRQILAGASSSGDRIVLEDALNKLRSRRQ